MDPSASLLNHFNQLTGSDLSMIASSLEHLELLNTNLNFLLKFSLKSGQVQCDEFTEFLEGILLKVLNRKQSDYHGDHQADHQANHHIDQVDHHIEFSRTEVNFVFVLCKLFSSRLSEKINSLILGDHRIALSLKIEIVQCLFEEKLVAGANSSFYVDFIFRALHSVCEDSGASSKQQRTKLIDNIVWVIFDFLKNDGLCGPAIDGIEKFLDQLSEQLSAIHSADGQLPADEQLVESVLDFIVSLIRFGVNEIDFLADRKVRKLLIDQQSESDGSKKIKSEHLKSKQFEPEHLKSEQIKTDQIKPEHVQRIKQIVNTERTRQLVVRSLLHRLNSSVRKKARYIADRFGLLSLDALEVLEVLEENQFHLIEPVLQRTLNCSDHQRLIEANRNIAPYHSVLEIVIERMFNHDCRLVKTAAFDFIQARHSENENILQFLSEQFILNQLISALQENQLYDSAFDYRSSSFLGVLPPERILIQLLTKGSSMNVFAVFFILKQLFSNLSRHSSNAAIPKIRLDVYSIQKFFSWLNVTCGEQSMAVQITVHLVHILTRNLENSTSDFEYLLHTLSCIHIKEVRLQRIAVEKQLPKFYEQFEPDKLNLNNSGVLTGFARYWAIIYHTDLDKRFQVLLDGLQARPATFKSFLIAFLSAVTSLSDSLAGYLIGKIADVPEVFELFCSRTLEDASARQVGDLLMTKIANETDVQTKFYYLSLLNDLKRIDDQAILLIDQVLASPDFRLQIQSERHWQLLNKYLQIKRAKNSTFNVDQIVRLFSTTPSAAPSPSSNATDESTTEILLSLPSRTSIDLNSYVIEFLGLLLNDELNRELPIDQTAVLRQFFTFTDLLFGSCQEDKKVDQYRRVFKVFIKAFAFNESLFHSKEARRFFADLTNRQQLDDLYGRICELNSLEVKSLLSGHLCNVVRRDLSLLRSELGDLLVQNLKVACLLGTGEQSLIGELKQQVADDPFISSCLNVKLKLDFYKRSRAKALSTCLRLDLDTLAYLIDQMIDSETTISEKSRIKNFVNSVDHRTLTKLWQWFLLVVLRLLGELRNDDDPNSQKVQQMLGRIYEFTMTSIVRQSSTTLSVKLAQQLIVIALVQDDRCPDRFYEQFKELLTLDSNSNFLSDLSRNKENEIVKVGYIVTLLTIIYHLIRSRPELKIFPVNYLLTCNHFKTRLFSYLVLSREDVRVQLSTGASGLVELEADPKSISGSHNLISNLEQLQKDWFFALFDCDSDLNVNFILQLLPRLSALYADDRIGFDLLSKYFDSGWISRCNQRSALADAVATSFSKPPRADETDEDPKAKKLVFQKKGYSGPQLDPERSRRRCSGELIICASLLGEWVELEWGSIMKFKLNFSIRCL